MNQTSKSYAIHMIPESNLTLSGQGSDRLWDNAIMLCDFHYPWEEGPPPRTSFKALHCKNWLYFLFDVDDSNVHIFTDKNHKWDVVSSDRVEIFFRVDASLSTYYCLEIDPRGRVLDYVGEYHRKINIDWSWPAGDLIVKTNERAGGYTVEFAIHKNSLRQLGLLKENKIEAGLFRAECTQSFEPQSHMRWISWVKPDCATPDFHVPSSFGTLELCDQSANKGTCVT